MSLIEQPRHQLTPMEILSSAVDGGADVGTLEKLLDLQQRWERGEARKAFDAAMAEAKASMPAIIKGREVDFTTDKGRTNYRYEDLGSIAAAINPILAQHGLSYRFRTESPPNAPISVTCIISHRLGHSEENTLSAPRDDSGRKNAIQAIGSAVTYLQRYTLKAALGLAASNDDDGRAAGGEPDPQSPPRQQQPPPRIRAAAEPFIAKAKEEIEAAGKDVDAAFEAFEAIKARPGWKQLTTIEQSAIRNALPELPQ
jgi:hypothetical protein